jgi:hypothetical protein
MYYGTEFVNDRLIEYCLSHGIELTRSRPYRNASLPPGQERRASPVDLAKRRSSAHSAIDAYPGGQRVTFRGFDAHAVNTRHFRVVAHSIQQHGLTYATESDHQNTFVGSPQANSLDGYSD